LKIGGAMISPKHANFIVNTGGAKASDIIALIEAAKKRVKEDTGILLETEVKVVGQ
jgi:UDP-N-acetylmuramate dehydrogenase